jgi:hypothetical protein
MEKSSGYYKKLLHFVESPCRVASQFDFKKWRFLCLFSLLIITACCPVKTVWPAEMYDKMWCDNTKCVSITTLDKSNDPAPEHNNVQSLGGMGK